MRNQVRADEELYLHLKKKDDGVKQQEYNQSKKKKSSPQKVVVTSHISPTRAKKFKKKSVNDSIDLDLSESSEEVPPESKSEWSNYSNDFDAVYN